MQNTADQTLSDVLAFLVVCLVVALALQLLLRALRRSRKGLVVGRPLAVGLVLRVLMAAAVSLTAYGSTLRGGDEEGFLYFGKQLGSMPLDSSDWTSALLHNLHIFILGVQDKLLAPPELALRVTEAGLAVAGIALLACAVYDLVGPRPALVAAWLLALEPTSVFFTTLIHKESLMMLATGLVAYGGAKQWTTGRARSLIPMAAGCAIAAMTRGYVSWFLVAASGAITLHAAFRSYRLGLDRSLVSLALMILALGAAIPVVVSQFNAQNLEHLQGSQFANTTDQSNLRLEAVDYSTGSAIVTNLPGRIRDVLLRPYPWQLGNISQQFGLMGTTVAYVLLVALAAALWAGRGSIATRAGPLLYVGALLLIAYSLSAGNAGTAFRYRTQIVAVGLCVVAALRVRYATERASGEEPSPRSVQRLTPSSA
jgi:hypothetical protein